MNLKSSSYQTWVLLKLTLTLNAKIAFANATRKFARDYEAKRSRIRQAKKLFDPRKFLADGKAIQASAEEIPVFGSEGKA